jgi:hypothetical protein
LFAECQILVDCDAEDFNRTQRLDGGTIQVQLEIVWHLHARKLRDYWLRFIRVNGELVVTAKLSYLLKVGFQLFSYHSKV